MNNIIFVLSGTGNSLWVAKEIAKLYDDVKIVSIGHDFEKKLIGKYDTIGFVYPTYAGGLPKRVVEFVKNHDWSANSDSYIYGIATCGRISKAPNATIEFNSLVKKVGIECNYLERLDMFSNYVIGYEMRETVIEEAEQSKLDLQPMLEAISARESNVTAEKITSRKLEGVGFKLIVNQMDRGFNVNDSCTGCQRCSKVCPVDNIKFVDNIPKFKHNCEQCLACIQNCPQQSINFLKSTQERRRYIHPEISWRDLAKLNN